MASLGDITVEMDLDVSEFRRNMQRMQGQLNDLNRRVQTQSSRAFGGFNSVLSQVGGSLGSIGSLFAGGLAMGGAMIAVQGLTAGFKALTTAIKDTIAEGIEYNASLEKSTISFEVMLGSMKDARNLMKDIQAFAEITPFETQGLVDSAKVMKQFGIETENLLPNLRMLGDIALGDSEKLKSLTLAFSQIQSTGKLMGQDLLQLINAGFNPLQIISEETGKSMGDLKDAMSKGAISAELVEMAFKRATSEGGRFFGGMDKLGQSFEGRMSTLRDTMQKLKGDLTKPFFDFIASNVLPKIQTLLDKIVKVIPVILAVSQKSFTEMKKLIIELSPAIEVLKDAFIINGKAIVLSLMYAIKYVGWFAKSMTGVVRSAKIAGYLTLKSFMLMGKGIQKVYTSIIDAYNRMLFKIWKGTKLASKIPGALGTAFSGVSNLIKKLKIQPVTVNFDKVDNALKKFLFSTKDYFKEFKVETDDSRVQFTDWAKLFENLLKDGSKATDEQKEKINALKKVFDELKDSIKKGADSFVNFVNVFDKVQKIRISAKSVFRRLEGQVKEMRRWKSALLDIGKRVGENTALFQELAKQGPAKAGEIIAVSRLSDEQLKQYQALFGEKVGIATEVSGVQQAGMRGLTGRDITINITGNNINDTMDVDIIANRIMSKLKLQGVQ